MIRVLTVDDHALLRDGIAVLIANQSDMELEGEAPAGRHAYGPADARDERHRPLSAIRGEFPEARIIVLTTYIDL